MLMLPQEFSCVGSKLENATGQGLAVHKRRRVDQFVFLKVAARDPHRAGRLAWRDDDPDAGMTASAHSTTSGVDHEAHQEPSAFSVDTKKNTRNSELVSGVDCG